MFSHLGLRFFGASENTLRNRSVKDAEIYAEHVCEERTKLEVERPAGIAPGVDKDRSTDTNGSPSDAAFADCQPFSPVDTVDA